MPALRAPQLELEGELRARFFLRCDLERRAHRPKEVLTDGQPQPGSREANARRAGPEAIEQNAHDVIRYALSRIGHPEYEPRLVDLGRTDRHRPFVGVLERVRHQIQQHPPKSAGISHSTVRRGKHVCDGQSLFLADVAHGVANAENDFGDGEGNGAPVHEPLPTLDRINDVARERIQTERRTVDETELTLLHGGYRPAAAAPPGLDQKEDARPRRPHGVRDLDHGAYPPRIREMAGASTC